MDVKDQVAAARHRVLALSERGRATLVVTGGDRVSWLNGLVTCDLLKRREGHATYGLFVARNGRILADAIVVDAGEKAFVSVPASAVEALSRHLDHYLVMEDAHVASGTNAFSVVSLHGPRSAEVLAAACDAGAIGSIVDRTGLGGAIVVIPEDVDAQACGAIEAAAQALGGVTGTSDGWQALRLERGIPEFGVDFGDATYPQEAALEKVAVSFDKGCYLGQEVVCMLEMRGHVKRKLVVLELEAGDAPPAGASVTADDGSPAGEVTSAVTSPTYGHPLALAMLKRAFAEVGRVVSVGGVRGRVVDRPT
jgi:folate-binding protein YgfZ